MFYYKHIQFLPEQMVALEDELHDMIPYQAPPVTKPLSQAPLLNFQVFPNPELRALKPFKFFQQQKD